jgi:uncharacterized protein (DUF2062 family)
MNFLVKKWDALKTLTRNSLKEGLSAHKVSLSISAGLVLGIFPLPGTTIILCILAAFVFRLNHLIIQAVNVLVYPLQLLLIVPFFRFGSIIFTKTKLTLSSINLADISFFNFISLFGKSAVSALLMWLLICIPIGLLFYLLLKKSLKLSLLKG